MSGTITITLRQTKGSPLTIAELDTNFSNIKAFTEALVTQISARLNDDGTLKAGAVNAGSVVANGILGLNHFAQAPASANKVVRFDASGNVVAADYSETASATDSTQYESIGAQTAKPIGSITFNNVPAGNILVVVTAWAQAVSGSNGGTLSLLNGAATVCSAPTHSVDMGATKQWVPLPMSGVIQNFAGGTLTLDFTFETSETTSDILFGVTGDGRFGRCVSMVAGL